MSNLASAVDELLAVDVRGLPDVVLVDEVMEIRRLISRLEAAYLARVEVLDRRGGVAGEHGSTAAWLRMATRCSPTVAGRDVHLARDLADALPVTAAALADGRISVAHAQLIASLRTELTDAAVAAVEPHLVEMAEVMSPSRLRGVVTHVRLTYRPDRVLADEQDLHAARQLHASSTFDGVGVGSWTLPPVSQETVMTAIHALSRPVAGDDRSAAQRRADALVTLAEIALRSGELPVTGGVKPHVTVVVRAEALAADSELTRDRSAAPAPGGADYGFGTVSTLTWTRRFLCDAVVSRIVLSATGEVLDAGRATRTFTPAQVRGIVARDRRCVWPGCDVPAAWCEAHHRIHWIDGGPTSADNGVLICGRHHDRVHLHGHAIVIAPDGTRTVDLRRGSDPHWRPPRARDGP